MCVVFGTRPEAIKLRSVIDALAKLDVTCDAVHVVCTSQHTDLLDDLARNSGQGFVYRALPSPMAHDQPLNILLAKMLTALDADFATHNPSLVIVQGDTSSALAGALAATHRQIPVAHIEAGLRTPSLHSPFPEEANRRLISTLAAHHFAPTEQARQNLLDEGVPPEAIQVTGNTSIDRLLALPDTPLEEIFPEIASDSRKRVLMTLHRRENLSQLEAFLAGLAKVLEAYPNIHVIWPCHPNPTIQKLARTHLGDVSAVTLLPALPHAHCVALLKHSAMVWTDSGGLQEEAITFGVPTLVLREYTDRPEGMTHNRARLSGASPEEMLRAIEQMLTRPPESPGACEIYGRGDAGAQIAKALAFFMA